VYKPKPAEPVKDATPVAAADKPAVVEAPKKPAAVA
jgi:hypothetical protein